MSSSQPLYAETAPSQEKQDEPFFSRIAGGIGWCLVVFGAVVALANIFGSERFIPEWMGWLAVVFGLVGVFVHAAAENDRLLRQAIGGAGVVGLLLGLLLAGIKFQTWGVGLIPFVPGLILLALFARREDDPTVRDITRWGLGAIGGVLSLVGVGAMLLSRWSALAETSAGGVGYVLTVVGLVTLVVFLSLEGSLSPIGRIVAIAMTAFGTLIVLYALARSTLPFVIHDWRSPTPAYAGTAAILGILMLVLGVAGRFIARGLRPTDGSAAASADAAAIKSWANIAILIGAAVGVVGILRLVSSWGLNQIYDAVGNPEWASRLPVPYLASSGVVQMFAGLLFVLASVGFWSEHRLVVMTRREFTSFFASPIAYVVMLAFTCIGIASYLIFISTIMRRVAEGVPMEEPIVARFFIDFVPVLAVMVAVPLLTMRLFSEEKRTGTLEVMLTAPVGEGLVLASKFIATMLLFMLLWVPWLLFLVVLRLESGQPFDFRPVMGFMLTLFVSGSGFIAMGMFFSSLTKNQIVAAAITFAGMMALIVLYFMSDLIGESLLKFLNASKKTADTANAVIRTVSFIDVWIEAIRGKIMLKDIAYHASATVMWLLATFKVLEARRWS